MIIHLIFKRGIVEQILRINKNTNSSNLRKENVVIILWTVTVPTCKIVIKIEKKSVTSD